MGAAIGLIIMAFLVVTMNIFLVNVVCSNVQIPKWIRRIAIIPPLGFVLAILVGVGIVIEVIYMMIKDVWE
jgi:hypothetical protein